MIRLIRSRLLQSLFATGLLASSASAQVTHTWTGAASGNWGTSGNWDVPTVLNGNVLDTLNFTYPAGTATTAITATNDQGTGTTFNINTINFNTFTGPTFTLANAASNTLTFNGAAAINNNGNIAVTMPAFVAAGNLTLGGTGIGLSTLGAITGTTQSITVSQAAAPVGLLRAYILSSTNGLTGGVSLDRGTVITTTTSTIAFGAVGLGNTGLSVSANGGTWANTNATGGSWGTTAGNINISSGGTLRLTGTSAIVLGNGNSAGTANLITGGGNLEIRSAAALTVNSNSTLSGTVLLDISPYSQLISNTTTGTLTLASISGGNAGSMTSVTAFEVRAGRTLALNNNITGSTLNSNRITGSVTLKNGIMTLSGFTGGGTLTESAGALTLAGYNTLTVTLGGTAGPTTLNFASATRSAEKGTVLIRGTSMGTTGNNTFVTFNTEPSGVDFVGTSITAGSNNLKIIPWVVGDASGSGTGSGFATYGVTGSTGSVGVRPLNTTTEISGALTAGTNVRLTTAVASANVTVNSLVVATSGSLTGTAGATTINVTSGGVMGLAASTIPSNITFPTGVEGFLTATAATTISGAFTGDSGLVKSGGSTVTLTGDNSMLTGTFAVNSGFITVAATTNIPGTGKIIFGGTTAGNVGINASGVGLTITRDLQITNGFLAMTPATIAPMVLSGVISGDGGIRMNTENATLVLSGVNTYKGPTEVRGGTIRINGDAALGDTTVNAGFNFGNLNTMILALDADWTTSRPINTSFNPAGTVIFDTSTFAAVWNGPFTNFSEAATGGTSTGPLNKNGTGSLTVNAVGTFSSAVNVNAGSLTFAQNGAWNASGFVMTANTSLTLDNTIVPAGTGSGPQTINRIRNDAAINLPGTTTLKLIGNASQTITEVLGTTTATSTGNIIEVEASGGFGSILSFSNLIASGGTLTVRGTALGSAALSGSIARIFLTQFNSVAVTNNQLLANVTWEDLNFPGVFSPAQYDTTRGIIAFAPTPVSGTVINNFNPDNVTINAAFTTTGDTTAITGVKIYSLTLDLGTTLTLTGGNPSTVGPNPTGNDSTPDGTFAISGGLLTNQTSAKTITSAVPRTIAFGAAATVTTTTDLTSDANITFTGGGGFTKAGDGVLTINGTYNITGAANISAGTLVLANSTTLGNLTGGGTLTLGANALTVNSANASTFTGTLNLSGAGSLTKTGTAVFTLTPSNALSYTGGTTIANGTLKLGNTNAANAVLGGAVTFGAVANTSGVLDLNGFSPTSDLTGFTVVGTGTGHQVINSNLVTASTVNLNLPGSISLPLSFGGFINVNKNDSNTLTLTGTVVATPAVIGGVFNVNAGTLQFTGGSQGLSLGMSVAVASGASFTLAPTTSGNNSANAFKTVAIAGGGSWINNGGTGGLQFYDSFVNTYQFGGGATITSTGTNAGGSFYHLVTLNSVLPTIVSTAGSTTTNFTTTNSIDQIQNDGAGPLVINVAKGTTPSGVDINFGIRFTAGTTAIVNKTGLGTMALSGTASNSTYAFNVNAGRLLANGSSTGSGLITVNTGGTLAGTGSTTSGISVASGGTLAGGNGNTGTLTLGAVTFVSGSIIGVAITDGSQIAGSLGQSTLGGLPPGSPAGPTSNTFLNKVPGTDTGTDLVNLTVDLTGYPFEVGQVYSYIIGQGFTTTPFTPVTADSRFTFTNGNVLAGSAEYKNDNLGNLYLTFTAIPEPSLMLGLAGLVGVVFARRRKA
ncbi:hypothetical protein BH11PLA2_BH11PLA2_41170 [soil metagenome]